MQEIEQRMEQLSRSARLQELGGTSSRMNEVESSLEQRLRATHDFMDEEGRIASGTAIEDAKADAHMEVGGRATQDAKADAHMEVGGRATQDAKAECTRQSAASRSRI